MATATLLQVDCREGLASLEENSVDAIVTDPPYGDFLGTSANTKNPEWEAWDSTGVTFDPVVWTEALRAAKPGAHLLAFSATRIVHRLAAAIEDAGWDIRDMLVWAYATGQVKSPKIPGGLGSSLKPAWEPIVMARKPFKGSLRKNIETWGTGGLRIDDTRIPPGPDEDRGGRWPTNIMATDEDLFGGNYDRIFLVPKPSPEERGSNKHPTVKPLFLARRLVRLVTPPRGLVVDPFLGSGTTCVAAKMEGVDSIGMDITEEYLDEAERRLLSIPGSPL